VKAVENRSLAPVLGDLRRCVRIAATATNALSINGTARKDLEKIGPSEKCFEKLFKLS
jgi:hypothetical protein